jgi:MFS family permease
MTASSPADGRKIERWVLVASILGSSMAFIDGTVVNVALPALQESLQATAAEVQWVVESYALALSALLLLGGALGDKLGCSCSWPRRSQWPGPSVPGFWSNGGEPGDSGSQRRKYCTVETSLTIF